MFVRTAFAAICTLAFSAVATAADLDDPVPIGSGEILIQYDGGQKPTDKQIEICHKLGGEIARTIYGGYACIRRAT
jgi:hypothetical protein